MARGPASKPLVTPYRGRAIWGNTAGLDRNILQGNIIRDINILYYRGNHWIFLR